MKNLLYILLGISILASCKKEPMENGAKTISGRIVQDCSLTPLANTSLKLLVSESQSFTGSEVSIYDFTSDANGNFSYTLNNPPVTFTSELRFAGTSIKGVVPKSANSRVLGDLIASPTANFVVKLKVNNTYNIGDTLAIPDFRDMSEMHISAPFKDTIFPTVYGYSSLNNRTLTNKNNISINSNSFIYNGVIGTSSFNVLKNMRIDEIVSTCSGMVDTVLIEIN